MIPITDNSIVYIACPAIKTGGPKSLHQLGDYLQSKGVTVRLWYSSLNNPLPSVCIYEEYNLEVTKLIEDNEKNILIVSDCETHLLRHFKKINKIIWWLSWGYYLGQHLIERVKVGIGNHRWKGAKAKILFIPLMIKYSIQDGDRHYIKKVKEFSNIYHLYNCEYVGKNILMRGAQTEMIHYLCGPVEFKRNPIAVMNKKEKIIYNPRKTDVDLLNKILSEVLSLNRTIEFVALKNMGKGELLEHMKTAKVYIDFGTFPGPERMPREAVLNYCNIITSNLGSAANDIDVPIPPKFKVSLENESVHTIAIKIIDLIDNYERYIGEYEPYRIKVEDQQNRFNLDINEIFEI